MSRPPKAIKPIEKYLSLPGDLTTKVDLKLFSEIEGRVPYGAWSRYVEGLIREDLSKGEVSAKMRSIREAGQADARDVMRNRSES